MTDDVIDYKSDRLTMGKAPGKDLEEGKLTLPLIMALEKASDGEKTYVANIVREKRLTDGDLDWVRDFLDKRRGIEKTLEKSRDYLGKAVELLAVFPQSEEKMALTKLADKILRRTY